MTELAYRPDRRRLLVAGATLLTVPLPLLAGAPDMPQQIERSLTSMAGLVACLAPDVRIVSRGAFVTGASAAGQLLNPMPDATLPATFRTAGEGVSSGGTHAFTYGYVTAPGADGRPACRKYVAYWVRNDGRWRIALFKRGGPAVDPGSETVSYVAPPSRNAAPNDLVANEALFAEAAGKIGLTAAFRAFGSNRAVNMGSGTAFTEGAEAISREVGGNGSPPPHLAWGADGALVAPQGDLGVTWGYIRDLDAAPARFAFFTVWALENGHWRYVAE